MRSTAVEQRENRDVDAGTLVAVALVAAALIAFEIVLMRRLLIERWHHFGYLVISVALLGFGASGTLLAIIEQRVRSRPGPTMFWLAAALAATLLLMPRVATYLPVTARFIPEDLWNQVGWWSLYWLAALVPFLIGATFLGAALMTAGPRVGRVYGANLIGSAAGAAGAVLIVSRYTIEFDLWPSFAMTVIAVLVQPWPVAGSRWAGRVIVVALLAAFAVTTGVAWPLPPSYDEYKYAARLERLTAQGSVDRVAARADPHGYVELYESDLFHDLAFLNLSKAPPPMYSLVVNGDPAGSVLRISEADQAAVMNGTLMAFPYQLIRPRPRVALLGETGGTNVWLARRQDAARIDVVQPNGAVISVIDTWSSSVFDSTKVNVQTEDPRTFLALACTISSRVGGPPLQRWGTRTPAEFESPTAEAMGYPSEGDQKVGRRLTRGPLGEAGYDLIQIASLEGLAAGGAGMRGLAEDHLVTVEGLADCLRALSDGGAVAISRGIQQPPRENIRLFATLVEALESLGIGDPSRHLIQVRDYLGVCTIGLESPLDERRREKLRAAISDFNLTPVWYDGLRIEEVNRPDALDGPPGTQVDWLYHAAREILSDRPPMEPAAATSRREQFYDSWLLNVRPPHDDRPFFWDFYRPGAIAVLKRAYGDLWLTRAELGRLFLYASLLIAAGAAIVLILVPLGVVQLRRRSSEPDTQAHESRATLATIIYFAGIGLGFMGIEMALISAAIRWLGDPVVASALVIGGVLLVSGVGSMTGRHVVRDRTWLAPAIVAIAAGVVRLTGWTTLGENHAGPWLLLCTALAIAYFMGMPMPAGIRALNGFAPRLVPWAWGVNGVASVIATSAAIVVAMTAGYRVVMVLAAAAYGLAALSATPLTGLRESRKRRRITSSIV